WSDQGHGLGSSFLSCQKRLSGACFWLAGSSRGWLPPCLWQRIALRFLTRDRPVSNQAEPRTEENRDKSAQPDPSPELTKLVELSAKYPEIGPPLADLCFKIGQPQHANRIVRMGLE